jgi:hypothetical protein
LQVGSRPLILLDQCDQCRPPMVLFGLESDQLRLVCDGCAPMRTGLPDPGCLQQQRPSHSGANRQSKSILNRFRCLDTAREKSRGRFGVRFQLRPALSFYCILIDTCGRRSSVLESQILMPDYFRPARKQLSLLYLRSWPSGSNSVGRMPASQAGRRGFEPRLPLHLFNQLGKPTDPSLCRLCR